MAAETSSLMLAVLLMSANLYQSTSAKTFTVGWSIPTSLTFYDDWAAAQDFVVGDKLAFTSTEIHNVYEVSVTDADACDASNPLATYLSASPTVTLSTAGSHAFICQVPGHCNQGMKMIVDVVTKLASNNDSITPADRSITKGPSAISLAPASPPPSSAFGLRSSLAFVVGAALAVVVPWGYVGS